MNSIRDILDNPMIQEMYTANMNYIEIAFTLLIAFVLGLFIFIIYKKAFQGVLYTLSFNISLVMLCLITAVIIITVTSNIVLSLGMVGALSIVRFRTSIKDPMDITFMFWAIATGIAVGAGFFELAFISAFFIGFVLIIMTHKSRRGLFISGPFLLIISFNKDLKEDEIVKELRSKTKAIKLKSKNIQGGETEMTCELRLKKSDSSFMNELCEKEGMINAVLMSYNGEYVS